MMHLYITDKSVQLLDLQLYTGSPLADIPAGRLRETCPMFITADHSLRDFTALSLIYRGASLPIIT